MSNENILTGDQALQEGRGSLILPEPAPVQVPPPPPPAPVEPLPDHKAFAEALIRSYEQPFEDRDEAEPAPLAHAGYDISKEAFKFLTEDELPAGTQIIHSEIDKIETIPLDEAEHEDPAVVKTYNSLSDLASPINLDENSIVITHHEDGEHDIKVESEKTNVLGTAHFCPMGEECNHFGVQNCKQAKLEADHRRDCLKGDLCDCFHPARGIPHIFRGAK